MPRTRAQRPRGPQHPLYQKRTDGAVRQDGCAGDHAVGAPRQTAEVTAAQDTAWASFLSLAADAQPGALEHPSTRHDTYLYASINCHW